MIGIGPSLSWVPLQRPGTPYYGHIGNSIAHESTCSFSKLPQVLSNAPNQIVALYILFAKLGSTIRVNQEIQFHVYAPTATKEVTQAQIVIQHYVIQDGEIISVPVLTTNPTEGDNRRTKSFLECETSLFEYYKSITSPISFGMTAESSLKNSFTHPSNAYQN